MFYLTHIGHKNLISGSEATSALTITFLIVVASIAVRARWENVLSLPPKDYFRNETSTALRGLAILLLVLGHFCITCVDGSYFFTFAGRWAVIIFLFISGVALAKKYGASGVSGRFLYQRILKLMPAVWVTLTIFWLLDYALLGLTYDPVVIALNYFGFITEGSPNPTAWYITYILFIYIVFYALSKTKLPLLIKTLLLYTLFCSLSLAIWNDYFRDISIWAQYAVVFPTAVAIGLSYRNIYDFFVRILKKQLLLYVAVMSIFLFLSIDRTGSSEISSLFDSTVVKATIAQVYDLLMIFALLLFAILLDAYRFQSSFLSLLGKYSFEIFLVHLPFMWKYDFLLFRKPLALMLVVYFLVVVVFSMALKNLLTRLAGRLNVIFNL